ncbi:MAG TPA: translation initiation factor IF-2 [Candidatus Saccharimonadia bacterium]|jgi:translation initiation factor IF-2|nr:translation initiation factor IF-2 [Candidatus Saccharimonadia bacterium]
MPEKTPKPQAPVVIPEVVGVGEFAQALGLPVTRVIGELMKNGVMATINEQIDFDTAAIIGSELGFEVEPEPVVEEVVPGRTKMAAGEGESRPPIVAVMGHVDHGKTSLLDAIRSSHVADKEAGGITQHIGAYQVKRGERWITFIDTPGHEAFSALRQHGARMTDVAIIVVAADDGVRPQTKEAIRHAQEAGVQLVVAVNKIDKEGADPIRVRQELSELGLTAEEWGGNVVMVDVSARTGAGIEKLLDVVLLVADIEDPRARPDGPSDGVIIESHLDAGKGPLATVLVRNGQLAVGDYLVAGGTYAKVRSLGDFRGKRIPAAHPGMPAVVAGFKAVPAFGDLFRSVENEKAAREGVSAALRREQTRSLGIKKIDASALTAAITAGNVQELNVVLKADTQGSLESLQSSLDQLRNDEVAVRVVSSAVGDISESDVAFAKTAGALLIGFNVSLNSGLKALANRERVQVRLYKVIYELTDDLRDALGQMLSPEVTETVVGELEIKGVFKTTKSNVVCGGTVTMGRIEPKLKLRVKRGGETMGDGTLTSLQKDKQAAKEVFEGETCGMDVATNVAIELGDSLEFYTVETKARTL